MKTLISIVFVNRINQECGCDCVRNNHVTNLTEKYFICYLFLFNIIQLEKVKATLVIIQSVLYVPCIF